MSLESPTTKAELAEALELLVRNAHRNGVSVDNGGYDLDHENSDLPDWDLTIIRMD